MTTMLCNHRLAQVEETLKGGVVRLLGNKRMGRKKAGGASLDLPKIRRNPLVEVVPISTGCLNQVRICCVFCRHPASALYNDQNYDRAKFPDYPPTHMTPQLYSGHAQCTYCKTKHARGELGSYPPEEILDRVKSVLKEGVVEIWMTSEDTGA
jgi:threonylcarbamoyladenosine tRNA methylthiotransferase CDKAL1